MPCPCRPRPFGDKDPLGDGMAAQLAKCQIIRWMSGGCQVDVRWMSGRCQVDVRWMSGGCQVDVRWMSGGCQWMSGGCQVDVSGHIVCFVLGLGICWDADRWIPQIEMNCEY